MQTGCCSRLHLIPAFFALRQKGEIALFAEVLREAAVLLQVFPAELHESLDEGSYLILSL